MLSSIRLSLCVLPIWYTLFQSGYHLVFIKYLKIKTTWYNKSRQNNTFQRTFLLVLDQKKTCTDTWLSNVSILDVMAYHYSQHFPAQHAWDQVKFPSRSFKWEKTTSEAKWDHLFDCPKLQRALCQEHLWRCHARSYAKQVSSKQGATVGEASRARILFWHTFDTQEPVHAWCDQGCKWKKI